MKKMLSILLVMITILGLMIPVFASAQEQTVAPGTMWVNCADGKRLNVRSEPKTGKNLLYRLDCGTKVEVVYVDPNAKGWAYITTQGHKQGGYVMTKFLVSSKPGKYEITERDDNFRAVTPYMVTTVALNNKSDRSVGLRVKPNKTASAIRRLSAGEQLQVVAVAKTWSKVYDPFTGRYGYVANDYIFRG